MSELCDSSGYGISCDNYDGAQRRIVGLEAENKRLSEVLRKWEEGYLLREIINEVYGVSNGKEHTVCHRMKAALEGGEG